ncbi:3539_t:CDS:2, partial [Diversispora eburnea]
DNNNNNNGNIIPQPPHPELLDLIIVAGHAIFVGNDINKADKDEGWILEDFQKGGEQVKTFLNHIRKGLELVENNKNALLIFSGGQTRSLAGPKSEAQSYWEIVYATQSLETSQLLTSRMTTEEFARDSYENLLFSICRFHEFTGNYPRNITIVGFNFKRKRFIELHRTALKFPLERFEYVGIDPETSSLSRFDGENLNSFGPFQGDIYGCHGTLRNKKLLRNPFRRIHPYLRSCPEISSLINYCPKNKISIYPGKLPWE